MKSLNTQEKIYFNWSSGKDSALALYKLQLEKRRVSALVTTINKTYNRVTMHGLDVQLLKEQAQKIGIPLRLIELPQNPSMETYEEIMKNSVLQLVKDDFTATAFGDIFLEDLKVYRENNLKPYGLKTYFPLWQKSTKALMQEFIHLGFKTIVVAINANVLDKSFVGRVIDSTFIDDLPEHVDPCGEHGEFHTFCFDGPIFKSPVEFELEKPIYKTYPNPSQQDGEEVGFWFADLRPKK
ncbi:MAG: diphthine--ammonia ligase [Flavobacteriales bacterium]